MQADVILKELPPTGTPPQPLSGAHVGGGAGAPPLVFSHLLSISDILMNLRSLK